MKNLIVSLFAVAAIGSVAFAAGPSPSPKPAAKAATLVCPFCKMTMTTTKSAKTPIAVKVKGTTFYCCTTCHPAKTKATPKPAATPAPK